MDTGSLLVTLDEWEGLYIDSFRRHYKRINFWMHILNFKPLDSCSKITGLNKIWDLCFEKHTAC